MTNRTKLPQGCWVTTFSADLPMDRSGMGAQRDGARARHTHLSPGSRDLPMGGTGRPVWRAAPVTVAAPRPARPRKRDRGHSHILPRALFTAALDMERKRADRFDEAVVLLLVGTHAAGRGAQAVGASPAADPDGAQAAGRALWSHVAEAAAEAFARTALLGWHADAQVVGAILPGSCGPAPESQLRRELARRIGAAAASHVPITPYVYRPARPRPDGTADAAQWPGDRHAGDRPRAHYAMKRTLDVVGSLVLLLLMAPLFLVVAALLKLTSPGPILFRQPRIGRDAQPFTMLKFRTMRVDADQALHHEYVTKFIKSGAELHAAGRKAVFKLTNDPRITPLGHLLRKSSMDELPQLWNVLRGEMSLVGPRPPIPYELEHYSMWHWRRVLDAKPGVTGLWQVAGRSRTTFDQMVRLDIRYVSACSLQTDIKILLATPRAVVSGKGAA